MKISIPQPLNEIGKRQNNEDNIYPQKNKATEKQHFFLVCDGMGGHENGEVASSTVCETFAAALKNVKPEDFNQTMFENALSAAYDALDKKDNANQSGKKMGTTLTFLFLNNKKAFMAHIGDSRIYHLRKSENKSVKIIYKSSDHSLVNELLQGGIITEEEAANHPKKNVITRAMQPHLETPCKADIRHETDVQANDYFFLCTDGVLESITDEQLCSIISQKNTDEEMIQVIYNLCNEHSRDNFSAYLVPVIEGIAKFEAETISTIKKEEEEEITIVPASTDPPRLVEVVPQSLVKEKAKANTSRRLKKKTKTNNSFLILIVLVLFAIGIFVVVRKVTLKPETVPPVEPPAKELPKPKAEPLENNKPAQTNDEISDEIIQETTEQQEDVTITQSNDSKKRKVNASKFTQKVANESQQRTIEEEKSEDVKEEGSGDPEIGENPNE